MGNEENMNKCIKVIVKICINLMFLGGILVLIGYLMGGNLYFNIGYPFSESSIVEETIKLSPFEAIYLDVDKVNVDIKEGNEYSICYYLSDEADLKTEVKDGILTVKLNYTEDKIQVISFNRDSKIIIYVPENEVIKEADLCLDVGNLEICDVEIINCKTVNEVGNTEFENIIMDNLVAKSDVGEISLEECRLNCADITGNIGNVEVELEGNLSDYDLELSSDMGNVKVNGEKEANTYKSDGKGDNLIKVVNDIGNVSVDIE